MGNKSMEINFGPQAVSDYDYALIEAAQKGWAAADAAGNQALKNQYHADAEAIRAKYYYSGGADGSEVIPLAIPAGSAYTPTSISSASSQASYIRELYSAQTDAALNALRSAYEQNVLAVDDAMTRVGVDYESARNRAHGDSEVVKNAFNERAAASGLASGAGSQARLSYDNALMGNLGAISIAEADKRADLLLEKAKLASAYRNSIEAARTKGDTALAKALYDDAVRVENSLLAAAKAQAEENYKAYISKY